MSLELDESVFSQAAGWDVLKQARACLAQGQVLSSAWAPPLLRGVVMSGGTSVRACFMTSQPAAWLKTDSSNSKDILTG